MATTCYRHPNRETGVSCSNCGRPICPECMTPTQVGMRCPECAKQTTKVHRVDSRSNVLAVTYSLIAINVVIYIISLASGSGLATGAGGVMFRNGALFGPSIYVNDEYYRLVTYGFLHSGLVHLGFNMFVLYFVGQMLEPSLGKAKFVALYFVSLFGGAFGALLLSPTSPTVGASGAVFGLLGAAFVTQRLQGINPMQTGIGVLIIINVVLSFVISNVSVGGHFGGLVAGAAAGWALEHLSRGRESILVPMLGCLAIGAIAVVGAIVAAGPSL